MQDAPDFANFSLATVVTFNRYGHGVDNFLRPGHVIGSVEIESFYKVSLSPACYKGEGT